MTNTKTVSIDLFHHAMITFICTMFQVSSNCRRWDMDNTWFYCQLFFFMWWCHNMMTIKVMIMWMKWFCALVKFQFKTPSISWVIEKIGNYSAVKVVFSVCIFFAYMCFIRNLNPFSSTCIFKMSLFHRCFSNILLVKTN